MSAPKGSELEAALLDFANIETPFPHWMSGDKAEPSYCYCEPCAEKELAAGNGEFVDGGWGSEESDTCIHCETCGRVLSYVLTEYGVASEIAHFRKRFRTDVRPLYKDEAYHLARILLSAPDDSDAEHVALIGWAKIK